MSSHCFPLPHTSRLVVKPVRFYLQRGQRLQDRSSGPRLDVQHAFWTYEILRGARGEHHLRRGGSYARPGNHFVAGGI